MPPSTKNSGTNRGNVSNLTPHQFKPGQSGNPGGRPKKPPITGYVLEQLDKPIPEAMRRNLPEIFVEIYGDTATFGQMIAFKLIAQAADGDMQAVNAVLDRVEGKVSQRHAISGDEAGSVEFTLKRVSVNI